MIAELKGVIVHKDKDSCVLDVHGIGFQVAITARTAVQMGRIGENAHLYTVLLVREDEWRLIGFSERAERKVFSDLLAVNGVGVKAALGLLGHFKLADLESIVSQGEWKSLQEAPGVGAKLAQRLQIELASRWQVEAPVPRPLSEDKSSQDPVVEGLITLGYSAEEAWAAVRLVPEHEKDEVRLRLALKKLDRTQGGVRGG